MTAPTPPGRSAREQDTTRPPGRRLSGPLRVGPWARVVRGVIAGGLSASLAAASHSAADTATPQPAVVIASVAIAVGVCVLLAGHRMGPVRMGSAVTISQGCYHLLFSLPGAITTGTVATSVRGLGPAHGHDHSALVALSPGLPPVETASWLMPVVHLMAAVVTYLLLRHGERAWWSLVDVLGVRVRRLLTGMIPWVRARRPLGRPGRFFHRDLHDLGYTLKVVTSRGPPVPVF
jgi:hypothetical protein